MRSVWKACCWAVPFVWLGCEGGTYVRHDIENLTEDSLLVDAVISGFTHDTVSVMLGPGDTYRHYTLDKLGKCHDCEAYASATHWVDTLLLPSATWEAYPGSDESWHTEVREGASWIEFEHRLPVTTNMLSE
ncbi:MAG TPA: hypothetical protein DHV07_04025 [Flavobacteriales bacterium]|nr:hypothetical protein [Flavobacteriales bacterium]